MTPCFLSHYFNQVVDLLIDGIICVIFMHLIISDLTFQSIYHFANNPKTIHKKTKGICIDNNEKVMGNINSKLTSI